jgi:hypothetical protein
MHIFVAPQIAAFNSLPGFTEFLASTCATRTATLRALEPADSLRGAAACREPIARLLQRDRAREAILTRR